MEILADASAIYHSCGITGFRRNDVGHGKDLGRARIYMKIDLQHTYHLVRIAKGDEAKTTFRMCYGSFEWLVIPKGLANTPSTFQCFINDTFSDMIDVSIVIYLDDILIYSDNLADHKKHVKEVL